ncbi:MAG: nickel pincer cofactor biosynthesis protein LarC [bacterium]
MSTAYLDCFSGISGDMTLGALLHAGLKQEFLLSELEKLNLSGYRIEIQSSKRGSISGNSVEVIIDKNQPVRNLHDILAIIDGSRLPHEVKEKSSRIFQLLAKAEAEVHNVEISSVHFHEVGAVDAVIDIVGAVIGMESLGIHKIIASPVNVGSGIVKTAHGILPVPAPATVSLLQGKPTYAGGISMELTTPTGAAILAGLVQEFRDQPLMKVERIGYGLGKADPPGWPNCLRILIGEENNPDRDLCWMIESNIDDMNPEIYGFVMERLFDQGALDVFLTPIIMKKGRPATRISVLSPAGMEDALVKIIFHETTAIGVRRYSVERDKLERKIVGVETHYGEIPVKIAYLGKDMVNLSPEYEACRKLASENKVPLKQVYNEALSAARRIYE